jgi:nitrite reductase/ring-hydroxylating ferredoxin subunit
VARIVRLCEKDAVEDDRLLVVEVDGTPIAVYKAGGSYRAAQGTCPHRGLPLDGAHLLAGMVICPNHFWRFDADTGSVVWPPTGRGLRHFPVTVGETDLYVHLDDEHEQPA